MHARINTLLQRLGELECAVQTKKTEMAELRKVCDRMQ